MSRAIAIDLGGSSGRVIAITLCDGKLSFESIHRFDNRILSTEEGDKWDIDYLLEGIKEGLGKIEFEKGDSISVDTWGVDYVLLDKDGKRVSDPFCYRDTRTNGMVEALKEKISLEELYSRTGLQTMQINTLFQLMSEKREGTLLMMPDYLLYELSGVKNSEMSACSTTQMVSPITKSWDKVLIQELGLERFHLLPVTKPGKMIGRYKRAITISGCGHDTQAALVAVPSIDEDFLFISSGTWSLMGTELKEPILSEKSEKMNLTNEIGYEGRISYMKNIVGLWILQCLKREWDTSYQKMEEEAIVSPAFECFIDPDDPAFTPTGNMEDRIIAYLMRSGQKIPQTRGGIVRCVYESLAMKYRLTRDQIEEITGKRYPRVHIIGGGSQDLTLSSFAASALGIPAILGPVEATAYGNALVQFLAKGELKSLEEARRVIKAQEGILEITPEHKEEWDKAFKKYKKAIKI